MKHILFVCLGNICRSPTAEGIFRAKVEQAGLTPSYHIDSAGTGAWHAGEPPDPRMQTAAREAGYRLGGRARGVQAADFNNFDLILAMDESNYRDLLARKPDQCRARVQKFRDYDPDPQDGDVPDPYYGGPEGFQEVVRMVARTSDALLVATR